MEVISRLYSKSEDSAIPDAIKTIENNPKFKRAIIFSLNVLHKVSSEEKENREYCYLLHKYKAENQLNKLIEHHSDDLEVVQKAGRCMLSTMLALPYLEVVDQAIEFNTIKNSIAVLKSSENDLETSLLFLDLIHSLILEEVDKKKIFKQGLADFIRTRTESETNWEKLSSEETKQLRKVYDILARLNGNFYINYENFLKIRKKWFQMD